MNGPVGGGVWPRIWWPFFRTYVSARLQRGLDGVWVRGLERTAALAAQQPVLIASNHVAWWDALLLIELKDALGVDGRSLMDAGNLRRFPFFRAAGALPLERKDRAQGRRDLDDAAAWLDAPSRALWIFPQGRQRPAHLRPLRFKRGGLQRLAERSGAAVVPVAFDYGFRESPRPAAVVAFGEPLLATDVRDDAGLAALERRVDALQRHTAGFLDGRGPGAGSFRSLWHHHTDTLKPGLGARLLGASEGR